MLNMIWRDFAISAIKEEVGDLLKKRRLVNFFQTLPLESTFDYLEN